jgi:hypothetical protein
LAQPTDTSTEKTRSASSALHAIGMIILLKVNDGSGTPVVAAQL